MSDPRTSPITRDEIPPGNGGAGGKNPAALDAKKGTAPAPAKGSPKS